MKYIAQDYLSHSVTGELIAPGNEVDLTHLTDDERLMLLDMGVIRQAPDDYTPFADEPATEEE